MTNAEKIVLIMELRESIEQTTGSYLATLVITLYPENFYKLGTVLYKTDKEVQAIQRNELAQMNMSTITKPSTYFPVYLYENGNIIIYPQSITSNITMSYLRKPNDVVWNFSSTTGYYVYDPTTSVDDVSKVAAGVSLGATAASGTAAAFRLAINCVIFSCSLCITYLLAESFSSITPALKW